MKTIVINQMPNINIRNYFYCNGKLNMDKINLPFGSLSLIILGRDAYLVSDVYSVFLRVNSEWLRLILSVPVAMKPMASAVMVILHPVSDVIAVCSASKPSSSISVMSHLNPVLIKLLSIWR